MIRLNFSVSIQAPREKVWTTMLADESYRQWTAVFSPGSHYVGSWVEGGKLLFLGLDDKSEEGGMLSRVKEYRPHEYVSIEHLGLVTKGAEDTSSEAARQWAGAQENYTFKDVGGQTEVRVEMDAVDEYRDWFEDLWPKALQKLKLLAEGAK
ncbi:SRPBCC family protein [Geoalkalibacter halelectricus]|uniref:SRPBCC family protein n=1 Tax=Geoalkalibacter halelectricus TaxID=2847045 RepID=UPI003D1F515D